LRLLSSPLLALGVWLCVMYAWHLPGLFQLALENDTVHVAEHLSFFYAGLLFWLPIVEPVPALVRMRPLAKLLYLGVAEVGMAALAALLIWGPRLYPHYDSAETLWGLSHAADQRFAGLVMIVIDMPVVLTAVVWIALREAAEADRRSRRLSPATEH
jgi:cytochrome c oxidase assembly factor CtaG